MTLELKISRTCSGAFRPQILCILSSEATERGALFHELYTHGLSYMDVGLLCERLHHYSKQQVDYLAGACREGLGAWLIRATLPVSPIFVCRGSASDTTCSLFPCKKVQSQKGKEVFSETGTFQTKNGQ